MIVLSGAKFEVTHLAFSPDAKQLATSGGGRGLEMWDLPSGNLWGRYTRNHHPTDGPVTFHPTQPVCFASSFNAVVEIESDTKGAKLLAVEGEGINFFRVRAMLPDGSGFVCLCNGHATANGVIWLLKWTRGKSLRVKWAGRSQGLTARSARAMEPEVIRVAPDGKTFVSLDAKPRTSYWDETRELVRMTVHSVRDGTVLRSAKLAGGTAPVLDIAPDSGTFVTCRANALNVCRADDLTAAPRVVRADTRARLTGVAFHPSGRYLATVSNDKTVKLYDTSTWEVARTFAWEIGRMRSVAFSPDGTLAAAGSSSGKVVVWDVDV